MDRKTFIKTSLVSTILPLHQIWPENHLKKGASTEQVSYFLGADQADDRIILFANAPNSENELNEAPIWSFEPDYRPTDAKRLDHAEKINVLVASHGAIYNVPFDHQSKIVWARTYPSCHSVEMLPDGNLLSACSNDDRLTIHYNSTPSGLGRMELTATEDVTFNTAHGIVYDRVRKCIWALGEVLAKFAYMPGTRPRLKLLDTYPLPNDHTDGHDLYPSFNSNLLITTHEGVLELPMGNFAYPIEKLNLANVKSAVSDETGRIYLTDPTDVSGYESWQTDTIMEVASGVKLRRPGAKFYKVRLWEKNYFSY
ncbi:MAG: hypothetical protein IPL46_24250 [Saprospiraceae bacterium]|nr:hypothetical protein [Saprospiraceae bacterium]